MAVSVKSILKCYGDSLGRKIALVCAMAVLAVFLTGGIATSLYLGSKIQRQSLAELKDKTRIIASLMEVFDEGARRNAETMSSLFISLAAGQAAVNADRVVKIGSAETPEMRIDGKVMNLAFGEVDHFTKITAGSVATIFARKGDDFYRVTTSLKKEDGSRAVGTSLDRNHPGYRPLLNGESYLGKARLFGRQYMTKYTPIKDASGRVIGSYFIGFDISDDVGKMSEAVKSIKVGETGYFYVFDGKGHMEIHPSLEGRNMLEQKDASGNFLFKKIIEQKNGVITYEWKNENESTARAKTAAFAYFRNWDWYVCGGSYDSEIRADAVQARNTLMALALFGSLLVSAIIFLAATRSMKGLERLAEKVRAITQGDLTVTIDGNGTDEVGRISHDMAAMTKNLQQIVGDIKSASTSVASGSEELNAGSEGIARILAEQSKRATQLAAAAEEMSQTIATVAKNTAEIATAATETSSRAGQGAQVMDKSIADAKLITEAVGTSASIIRTLGDKSREIGEIVEVIQSIADQTNLLALNAAIESARAGEQGRGFAVVADEVRKLAERTSSATARIGEMIGAIRAEVDSAVAAMTETNVQVQEGLSNSMKAGEQLAGIVRDAAELQGMTQQIAAAADQMSSTSEGISDDVQGVAGASKEITGSAEQISGASSDLAKLAGELKEIVDRFKV